MNQSCLTLLLAILLPLLFCHSRSFRGPPASSANRASAMSTSSSQALTLWMSPPWVCEQRPSHRLFPSLQSNRIFPRTLFRSSESRHTNQLCSISQCDANSLLSEISRASLMPESTHIAKPVASWLDDFLVWMSPEAFGCCRKFVDGSYYLDNGRPSTAQFKEKLPWFLNALPSADCAKGGHGAYTSSVDLNGYESGVIRASEFCTYHTPLRKQDDFVNSMHAAREFSSRVSDSLKHVQIEIFPYSVFYIFFEQYLDIWETAVINIAIALGAVFLVCLVITSSLWSSAIIVLVLAMIAVDLLEAVAVVWRRANSTGLARKTNCSVENISALNTDGITLTKLVGVIVLYFTKSEIFVVVLSMFGPPSRSVPIEREQELETSTLSCLTD
ncbi:unnamed protein product [Camellia sinensis]